jgi:hypothetical protein
MLTVKIIRPDGTEWVEEAKSVCSNTAEQSATHNPSVTYFTNDKEMRCIDIYEGTIYVMNENGKTIADYYLLYPK